MSGMVGRDAVALNRGDERMVGDTRIFGNHVIQHVRDGRRPRGGNRELAVFEAPDGFITGAPGRQKDNGRGQTVVSKDSKKIDWVDGRWHERGKV